MSLFKFKKEKVTKKVETSFLTKEQMGGVVGGIDTLSGVTAKDTTASATSQGIIVDTTSSMGGTITATKK